MISKEFLKKIQDNKEAKKPSNLTSLKNNIEKTVQIIEVEDNNSENIEDIIEKEVTTINQYDLLPDRLYLDSKIEPLQEELKLIRMQFNAVLKLLSSVIEKQNKLVESLSTLTTKDKGSEENIKQNGLFRKWL